MCVLLCVPVLLADHCFIIIGATYAITRKTSKYVEGYVGPSPFVIVLMFLSLQSLRKELATLFVRCQFKTKRCKTAEECTAASHS